MLRRVLRKRKFRYDDTRNMSRNDKVHFDWLVGNGFFTDVKDGWYEITDKGKAAADLGFYEV